MGEPGVVGAGKSKCNARSRRAKTGNARLPGQAPGEAPRLPGASARLPGQAPGAKPRATRGAGIAQGARASIRSARIPGPRCWNPGPEVPGRSSPGCWEKHPGTPKGCREPGRLREATQPRGPEPASARCQVLGAGGKGQEPGKRQVAGGKGQEPGAKTRNAMCRDDPGRQEKCPRSQESGTSARSKHQEPASQDQELPGARRSARSQDKRQVAGNKCQEPRRSAQVPASQDQKCHEPGKAPRSQGKVPGARDGPGCQG